MNGIKLVKDVLEEIEDFALENNFNERDVSLFEFREWLNKKYKGEKESQEIYKELEWPGKGRGVDPHFIACSLVTHLSRYKLHYIKLALTDSIFDTYDEFSYVLNLIFTGSKNQSQLIEKNIQSKPTGSEIIHRLERKKIVSKTPSKEDKRVKILEVTPLGRKEFYKILNKISSICDMVTSPITELEKLQLLKILQKLDAPHRELFSIQGNLDLNELMDHFDTDIRPALNPE
ncbi:MarR family winged helix-turn-helix transcriptional regulator [Membranihabitans maritimus]|uniref:MarR family winged helix-turn-helix transcriptional regulator n=1 Tax=Membranihabitans maritimus TaxID=2904244 RepID=UPI001F36B226|nr:MarR family winged helix-turn-helix transcriptional regulator [Membranihabitans maritimus]